jgi:hypothetical protein
VKVVDDQVGLVFKITLLLCRATGVDFGFVANHRWEEGIGCQDEVTQFISYLIVTRDHESTFLAPKSMMDAELPSAAITM